MAVAIATAFKVSRPAVRRQGVFLIVAASVTVVGNLFYVTGIASVNPTVAVLSVSISMIVVAMARDGLFGVIPAGLSQVSANHPDGVVIIDSDGFVAYANERTHALLAPVVLPCDRPVFEILQDAQLKLDTARAIASLTAEECWRAMSGPTGVLLRLEKPTRRWLQVVGSELQGTSGRTRGYLVHLSDVTERQRAARHARQRRRLESVRSLAHSVSRDFHGAFNIVNANANLLGAELGESPSQRHVARIIDAARIGADLVQELETYTGSAETIHAPLDLAAVVADACRLVAPSLPPDLVFHHRPQRGVLCIDADRIQVRECILSLIANAVEATASVGREIEVSTGVEHIDPARMKGLVCGIEKPAGRFAYVEVRDEGGGMHPDVEERAFEPFFSTREKNRGSGLANVLGIARANDAAVALYNDPGWGCTFTVYFPLRDDASAEASDGDSSRD
jgi:signal transduction histidine kinase